MGYKNPRQSLRTYVMVREVDDLNGFYHKQYVDDEGFTVGVLYELIYDDANVCRGEVEKYVKDGWTVESHTDPH